MSTIGHFTAERDMHAECTTKSFSAADRVLWTMTHICSTMAAAFSIFFCFAEKGNIDNHYITVFCSFNI